jgi:hypothetical protein
MLKHNTLREVVLGRFVITRYLFLHVGTPLVYHFATDAMVTETQGGNL